MSLKAIIFDLGGTLIDWPDWDQDAYRRWGLAYDYLTATLPRQDWPARDRYVNEMRRAELAHWVQVTEQQRSMTPDDLIRSGFRALECSVSVEEILVALDGYGQAVNGWATICPDAVETLLALRERGYKLGLLSNTWWAAAWHNADLATHGLDALLDKIFYTSDLSYSKPHPEAFLTVARALEVPPEECLMIGDRLIDDVSGALAAGMRAIWKRTTSPWPSPEHIVPTATITDLSELPSLLDCIEHTHTL